MQPLSVLFFLTLIYLTSAWDGRIVMANGSFTGRKSYRTLTVPNGETWGEWTSIDMCPEYTFAIGFSIKVLEYGGYFKDDSSLNGVRLFCSIEPDNDIMYSIESDSGEFGEWSRIRMCPRASVMHAFQMKVEPYALQADNTAVNNIKFRCSNGISLEEAGGPFGQYGTWSNICYKGGVCGLQTRLHQSQGAFRDDTAVNDLRLLCCE